jgi:dolichol-phosphate mannosyltransferase
LISVVFSFRNEAANIPVLLSRLELVLSHEDADYELIFVNDASVDNSLALLLEHRKRNSRVKIINMSRRFGVAECVRAGLAAASGDAVIYMDADLQDPPETIPKLLESWRLGADVVHTIRARRHGENRLKMLFTRLAYRIIHFGSSIDLPVDAGDFKLLSRAAVEHLLRLPESDPYFRGLTVWVGFRQVLVPYEREARYAGKTHFPLFSRNPWKTFVMGLTSFSFMPVYACGIAAVLGMVVSLALIVISAIFRFLGLESALITFLAGGVLFLWSTLLGGISIVGIYVVRAYKDLRNRPHYIVESCAGLTPDVERILNRGYRPSGARENANDI